MFASAARAVDCGIDVLDCRAVELPSGQPGPATDAFLEGQVLRADDKGPLLAEAVAADAKGHIQLELGWARSRGWRAER
jgi:hypothetical protein